MLDYLLNDFEVVEKVKKSFDILPVDQYLKSSDGEFRFRRYHTGLVNQGSLKWHKNPNYFEQSTELNSYGGGIVRKFPPIESATLLYVSEFIVMPSLANLPKDDYSIGVHQIRVTADTTTMGKPAPEGVHQDGFDYIVVSCVATENIVGGNSLLLNSLDYSKIAFDQVLDPGQSIIFNDQKYAHYVSPIVPKTPGKGYRDVFVTTIQKSKNLII